MAKVKNINGTSQTDCICGSWLQHWEKYSGRKATYCSDKICIKTELVGAHVQKAFSSDNRWYIIPLCKVHNGSIQEIEISDSIILVSANKEETCEKRKS